MKKHLIILFLLLLGHFTISAQTKFNVSTIPGKKNLLIEEFTGTSCGHCPDGHRIASLIEKAYEGNTYVVNIHAGTMANPGKNRKDFRTDEGEKLLEVFNTCGAGFPCAMINRHVYDEKENRYLYTRSLWFGYAERKHSENAPVNLYMSSVYDHAKRELKVHVEGYNVENNEDKTMTLNVLLSQDNIIGIQNGNGTSPDYNHMRVLRGYITNIEGDTINETSAGTYFTRDYIYTVPEKIRNIDFKPEDMNILAFVTLGDMSEVLNVIGSKPQYKNFEYTPVGELFEPKIPINGRYGFKFFETYVKNYSTDTLKYAHFDVTTNNITESKIVECLIPPFCTGSLIVPCNYEFTEKGVVKYSYSLVGLNDNNIEPSTIKGQFTRPAYTNETIRISILSDTCVHHNKFLLKDENGNIIKELGPYKDGVSEKYDEEIILEEGKTYCFEVYDINADGMFDGVPGSVTLRTGNGKLIDQFYRVKDFGVRSFFTSDKSLQINNIDIEKEGANTIFSLSGIRLNDENANEKIIIKNGVKIINNFK